MGLFRESLDRDEDMLLDAARSAATGAAKLSPEVGLREQFERYDVDDEGVVDEADFDGVLRSFGCLGHHRRACLRRFGGRFRDGRVDYLDFAASRASATTPLEKCVRSFASTIEIRDAEELLQPLLERDPRGSGVVPVRLFRAVLLKDWRCDAAELQLQSLCSRFAAPRDPRNVDYEHFVRHVAAALPSAGRRRRAGDGRSVSYADGVFPADGRRRRWTRAAGRRGAPSPSPGRRPLGFDTRACPVCFYGDNKKGADACTICRSPNPASADAVVYVTCPACGHHNRRFGEDQKCEICDLELMSSRSARALASSVAKPERAVPLTRPDPKDHGGWRGLDESDDDDDAYPRAVARRSRPASPPRSPRSPRWRD
ncbi:hypothetical protein JL721_8551 [Aureococcus anophagefferens]|nr:hypothetical protein JL721_8551 [Aureococcus anophagefferens]